jgi:hypothetical protein
MPVILTTDNDQYVSISSGYGLYVYIAARNSYCLTGMNINPAWWGSPPPCPF